MTSGLISVVGMLLVLSAAAQAAQPVQGLPAEATARAQADRALGARIDGEIDRAKRAEQAIAGEVATLKSSPDRRIVNPLQIARLRWYDGMGAGNYVDLTALVGRENYPEGCFQPRVAVFDGVDLLVGGDVGCAHGCTVVRLRPSDAAALPGESRWFGHHVEGLSFDGLHVWMSGIGYWTSADFIPRAVKDGLPGAVTLPSPPGGGPPPVPTTMAFDGSAMWIAAGSSVLRLAVEDASVLSTHEMTSEVFGLATDGSHMWVACHDGTVAKIRHDGLAQETFHVSAAVVPARALGFPALAFDGSQMWTVAPDGKVIRLRGDGAVAGTLSFAQDATTLVFDGAYMWIAAGSSVIKVRVSDNSIVRTFTTPGVVTSLTFDGANVWAVNGTGVSKF